MPDKRHARPCVEMQAHRDTAPVYYTRMDPRLYMHETCHVRRLCVETQAHRDTYVRHRSTEPRYIYIHRLYSTSLSCCCVGVAWIDDDDGKAAPANMFVSFMTRPDLDIYAAAVILWPARRWLLPLAFFALPCQPAGLLTNHPPVTLTPALSRPWAISCARCVACMRTRSL